MGNWGSRLSSHIRDSFEWKRLCCFVWFSHLSQANLNFGWRHWTSLLGADDEIQCQWSLFLNDEDKLTNEPYIEICWVRANKWIRIRREERRFLNRNMTTDDRMRWQNSFSGDVHIESRVELYVRYVASNHNLLPAPQLARLLLHEKNFPHDPICLRSFSPMRESTLSSARWRIGDNRLWDPNSSGSRQCEATPTRDSTFARRWWKRCFVFLSTQQDTPITSQMSFLRLKSKQQEATWKLQI